MRVLLVEDDPALVTLVREALRAVGHAVDVEGTGRGALTKVALEDYGAIVLDLGLPDLDGLSVSELLRRRGHTVPILMLTARDAVGDRIRGLDSGADDYLVKPFAVEELIARLRALGRRMPALRQREVVVADLVVDTQAMRATRGGRALALTQKEYMVLECLAKHAGEVVSRATITAYVWDENHDPLSNTLEVTINRLRAKLDAAGPPLLHTRRGAGYVLRDAAQG